MKMDRYALWNITAALTKKFPNQSLKYGIHCDLYVNIAERSHSHSAYSGSVILGFLKGRSMEEMGTRPM